MKIIRDICCWATPVCSSSPLTAVVFHAHRWDPPHRTPVPQEEVVVEVALVHPHHDLMRLHKATRFPHS